MVEKRELNRILTILKNHENRIRALEVKKENKLVDDKAKTKSWYKLGGTTDKLVLLIRDDFFNIARTINEIIAELKIKDYHLEASDLTLPLRRLVRKRLLKRTKNKADGSVSKRLLYEKA